MFCCWSNDEVLKAIYENKTQIGDGFNLICRTYFAEVLLNLVVNWIECAVVVVVVMVVLIRFDDQSGQQIRLKKEREKRTSAAAAAPAALLNLWPQSVSECWCSCCCW